MDAREEKAYEAGGAAVWRSILGTAIGQLRSAGDDVTKEMLILERAEAVSMLRRVCAKFGDTEWDEQEHLADIIDKHLGRHLHGRERGAERNVAEDWGLNSGGSSL